MKICMLSSGHSPRDDRIFYKETLTLAKRFDQIYLVMPADKLDYKVTNSNIIFVALRKSKTVLSRFFVIPQAIITILKIRPQICHFHDYELIFALPFIRLFSRCKIIYDVHESYPEMAMESKKFNHRLRSLLGKLVDISEMILSRLADHIITSDDNIADRFKDNHSHVTTIFNYPRLSIFIPDKKKLSHLTKRYKNKTPIIYQGGISLDRGLFKMFEAMKILKQKRPDIILLMVGKMSDELLNQSREYIRNFGLQNNIDIVGWVPHEDIVNYIHVSKIGLVPLLPTKKFLKNIPIKQFEYMACGIPVLGADLPPIASYINSSGCGRVFDSTNPHALVAGIDTILGSELEWRRMSEKGKRAVQYEWNWDIMEKKLFAVYEDLLGVQ